MFTMPSWLCSDRDSVRQIEASEGRVYSYHSYYPPPSTNIYMPMFTRGPPIGPHGPPFRGDMMTVYPLDRYQPPATTAIPGATLLLPLHPPFAERLLNRKRLKEGFSLNGNGSSLMRFCPLNELPYLLIQHQTVPHVTDTCTAVAFRSCEPWTKQAPHTCSIIQETMNTGGNTRNHNTKTRNTRYYSRN